MTGAVDEATKEAAIAGCLALVQPSYFESLSMVLLEAWAHRRPALVQGRCDVLVGQARRSGGAIPYTGFAEFEAAVDLVSSPGLGTELGVAGRPFVEERYGWDDVLSRYERFLDDVVATWRVSPTPERRRAVGGAIRGFREPRGPSGLHSARAEPAPGPVDPASEA